MIFSLFMLSYAVLDLILLYLSHIDERTTFLEREKMKLNEELLLYSIKFCWPSIFANVQSIL